MGTEMQEELACRICYSHKDPVSGDSNLISPCDCKGSLKFVHSNCLRMWRFKGNFLSEIKKCETCHSPYKITGERSVHRLVVALLSTIFISTIYLICTLFFDTIFIAAAALFKDICIETLCIEYVDLGFIKSDLNYHFSCTMVLITFYKLYFEPNMLSIINYIFTFWRIVQFNFMVDKLLFAGFSLFFIKDIFKNVYKKTDRFIYYLLNATTNRKSI